MAIAIKRVQGVFYGWWVVTSGFVLQALNQGLLNQGFTVYFLPLQAEFGWSGALLSSGKALSNIETGALGPLEGWLADRFGPRRIVFTGVLFLGTGFVILSTVQSIVHFFVAFLFITAGSSLGGFTPLSVAIINWFSKKRSMALAVAMAGTGIGGLLVPLLAIGVTDFGWRSAALASGLIIWACGIPMALLLRHKPEQYGYLPDGDPPDRSAESVINYVGSGIRPRAKLPKDDSYSAMEALKTRAFWLIACGHASALFVVSAVSLHLVPHLVKQVGMTPQGAGLIVSLLMGMSIVGRVIGGLVADRMDKRILLVTCMFIHCIALLLLAYATTVLPAMAFATLHGIAWGARAPAQQSIRADYFGRTSIGFILGLAAIPTTVTSVAAPIFAGWLADIRGDYQLAFTILAILTALGSLFFVFASKPTRKTPKSLSPAAIPAS